MTDHNERDTCDRCHATTRLGDEREQPADDEPLYCDPCAQTIAGERLDARRAAFLEMAEECERRADDGASGPGQRVCRPRCSPSTAAELKSLAAWARGRAGA